jgi:hypothetical protein
MTGCGLISLLTQPETPVERGGDFSNSLRS